MGCILGILFCVQIIAIQFPAVSVPVSRLRVRAPRPLDLQRFLQGRTLLGRFPEGEDGQHPGSFQCHQDYELKSLICATFRKGEGRRVSAKTEDLMILQNSFILPSSQKPKDLTLLKTVALNFQWELKHGYDFDKIQIQA